MGLELNWKSLMILGSAQLLVLGIFGEYLGRLYIETKRRPLYIINRIVSQGREDIWTENLNSKIIIVENPLVRKNYDN